MNTIIKDISYIFEADQSNFGMGHTKSAMITFLHKPDFKLKPIVNG